MAETTKAPATETPATEAPKTVEVLSVPQLSDLGWQDFLELYPYNETNVEEFLTLDDYHDEKYLVTKLNAILRKLKNPSSITKPPDIDARVAEIKKAMSLEGEAKHHIPELDCDLSYAEFLIKYELIIDKAKKDDPNFNPYQDYLTKQKSYIQAVLQQITAQSGPDQTKVAGKASQAPAPAEFTAKPITPEKQKKNYSGVVFAAFGLAIICSALVAHQVKTYTGFLDILRKNLAHPTPTLATPIEAPTLTATPDITPTPTELNPSPTPERSGDDGDSIDNPPKYKVLTIPRNEVGGTIKAIDLSTSILCMLEDGTMFGMEKTAKHGETQSGIKYCFKMEPVSGKILFAKAKGGNQPQEITITTKRVANNPRELRVINITVYSGYGIERQDLTPDKFEDATKNNMPQELWDVFQQYLQAMQERIVVIQQPGRTSSTSEYGPAKIVNTD